MKKHLRVIILCLLIVVIALSFSACKAKVNEDISSTAVSTVYDGKDYSITVEGMQDGDKLTYSTSKAGVYKEDKISFADVGEYSVFFRVTRKGFETYEGNKTVTITPATLTVTPNAQSKQAGGNDPVLSFAYTGNVMGETPDFTGTLTRAPGEEVGNYLISIGSLKLADKGSFKSTNYTLALSGVAVNFKITAAPVVKTNISNAVIVLAKDSFVYNGEEISPAITSAEIGETSLNATDYTIAYTNNINVGTATVTITGKGNFEGTASTTFAITVATLTVTPNELSKEFGAVDPTLTYTFVGNIDGETPAFEGTLTRAIGEDAGDYVLGIGSLVLIDNDDFVASNYILKISEEAVNFSIAEEVIDDVDISDAVIVLANDSFIYNGEEIAPEITSVKIGEIVLTASDYTVALTNNINVGTATVTVTGKGNFEGTASTTFAITKATLTITPNALSKEIGDSDVTITYEYSGNVTGETPSFNGVLSREIGEAVGTYAINIGTLGLGNNGSFLANNYLLTLSEVVVKYSITECNCSAENGYGYVWTDAPLTSNITVNGTRAGDTIEYSTNGSVWYASQSSITFNQEGAHSVLFRVSRNSIIIKQGAAFVVAEEAILDCDFEDEILSPMIIGSRAGDWTSNVSKLSIVDYNGSKMVSAAYTASGMNGILLNVYENIPAGANYIAVDLYTSGTIKYKYQFFKYTVNRGAYEEFYSGSPDNKKISETVYVPLSVLNSSYIWLGLLMNISDGYGTVYYDNIRFTTTNTVIEEPDMDAGPSIVEPALNSIQSGDEVTFVWHENPLAGSYNIYLYGDEGYTQLIANYNNRTGNSAVVDLSSLTISQKVYWQVTSISLADGQESSPTEGYFYYSDYNYGELNKIDFQAGQLDGVSWRNNTSTSNWTEMQGSDLVTLPNGDTVYKTETTSGTQLMGVKQTLTSGAMASGLYDTISFTLSTDFPGTYLYRVWIYNTGGQNYELTEGSGVSITVGKNATTFYRKLEYGNSINKDNIISYAVQLMGNANPIYFHSMGIMDLSYEGSISPVTATDFVMDKTAVTLSGTLDWADLDVLTGEYYVQLWFVYMGQEVWFITGTIVYDGSQITIVDGDMSDYSGYLSAFTEKDYLCNYKIIAKSSLNDAGTTTFEGTVNISLTVIE